METLLWTVVGLVLGAVANWYFARRYYIRSSEGLREEAAELKGETQRVRRLVNTLSRAMEESGLIDVNRDESGEMVGIVVRLGGSVHGTAKLEGNLTSSGTLTTKALGATSVEGPEAKGATAEAYNTDPMVQSQQGLFHVD